MRRLVVLSVAACCLAAAKCQAAGTFPTYPITVRAAETGYTEVPLSRTCVWPPGARSLHLWEAGGKEVPCDVDMSDGMCGITWILRELPKGASRKYLVKFSDSPPRRQAPAVRVFHWQGAVEVSIDGGMFTRYYFAGAPKPYCWPIIGPTGKPVTRAFPMEKVEGESKDHPHHRSMWFTHGSVNGQDFWSEGDGKGKTVHRKFEALDSAYAVGRIRERNDWIAADGKKVCEDVRDLRVYNVNKGRLMDFEVTLLATEGPVTMGDTKEGMFGMRIADSMTVVRGSGHILNSEGQRDKDTWGKRANWCDYWGPVDGKTVGIAILDHPDNFRHPTYWHVRDYGLFAANPFGVHDFLGQKEPTGEYTIPKGGSLTFRYRIYIHEGDAQQADIASLYEQYAHPPVVRIY